LFSKDRLDLPISQFNSLAFKSICLRFFGYVVVPGESTVQLHSEMFNAWRLWNIIIIIIIQSYLWALLSPEREVYLDRFSLCVFAIQMNVVLESQTDDVVSILLCWDRS
jgi:hypothetical protein